MSASPDTYEVYAIRYAQMKERIRRDNFIVPIDPHDGPMPMDYFVWLLKSKTRTILVDTGFSAETARIRQRELLRCPIEALGVLGVAPESVQDVVLTHLHYDHAGNLPKLPQARFHVQDAEMDYATGRCMCHGQLRHAYSVEDVVELVRKVYADRVVFHAGDAVLAPGGLLGRVASVTPTTATVVLLTDSSSRIGVWVGRVRHHGLLVGVGTSRPVLRFIERDVGARPGDVVTTSPASTLLPPNLTIGVIQRVNEQAVPAPEAVVQLSAPVQAVDWVQVQRP